MSDLVEGWLNLNKEAGISSFRALSLVKRKLGAKKAGYLGTLDPLATGVLVIALGKTTKLIRWLDDSFKEYEFTIEWGAETDTLDSEGLITRVTHCIPSCAQILEVLPSFIGEQEQIPPRFSAVHVSGKRAYLLARAGIDFQVKPRKITIHYIDCISHTGRQSVLKVGCSRGTYVRAIVRDIAHELGSLAFAKRIHRTRSGPFSILTGHRLPEVAREHLLAPNAPFS